MRVQEIININYKYLIYQIFRVGLYKCIHHPKAVVLKCSLYPDHLEDLFKQILGPTWRVFDFLVLVWGSRTCTSKKLSDNANAASSVTTKWQATLEDSLVVFYKSKQNLNTKSCNHVPKHSLKSFENLCPHKICQKMFIEALFLNIMKATRMSFGWRMKKQKYTIVYYSVIKDTSYQVTKRHRCA